MGKGTLGKARRSYQATIAGLMLLCGCSTPTYVDTSKKDVKSIWPNRVEFSKKSDVIEAECVTVNHFFGDFDEKMTTAFKAQLSVKTRIGDECSLSLDGKVLSKQATNALIVSRTAAGAEVELTRDGETLWSGSHTASTWGGGIPLDPFSAVVSLVNASDNAREEQGSRILDDLARRLVSTMPEIKQPIIFVQTEPKPVVEIKPVALVSGGQMKVDLTMAKFDVTSGGDRAFDAARRVYDERHPGAAVARLKLAAHLYLQEGRIDDAEKSARMIEQIAR
jgi:hypothetical protein